MRVYLVAVLVALVVYVSGQQHPCDHHDHCHGHAHDNCPGHTIEHPHVVCHDGLCVCTGATNQTCTQESDCMCDPHHHPDHPDHPPPPPPHPPAQCLNGMCQCPTGPGGH